MTDHNLQESLQPLATLLNNSIIELVKVDLSRQWGDGDAGALTLENVAKVFKVRVATAHAAVAQFEAGDVG